MSIRCFFGFHNWKIDRKTSREKILMDLNAHKDLIARGNQIYTDMHCIRDGCKEERKEIVHAIEHWKKFLKKEYKCDTCEEISIVNNNPILETKKIYSNYLRKNFYFCSKICLNIWLNNLVAITCPNCNGRGECEHYIEDYCGYGTCSLCQGSGKIQLPKEDSFIG